MLLCALVWWGSGIASGGPPSAPIASPAPPASWDEAGPVVMPRLISRTAAEAMRRRPDRAPEHESLEVAPGLAVDLVVGSSDTAVRGSVRRTWGIELDAAVARAVENLRSRSTGAFRSVAPGVWTSTIGDGYDASRLLLTAEIAALGVAGSPVAVPSNRDRLLIAGSGDPGGLLALASLAADGPKQPKWVSSVPVMLVDGRWEAFEAEGEVGERMRALAVRSRAQDYANQALALASVEPRALAIVTVLGDQEVVHATMTFLETGPLLLPEVDWISIGSKGDTPQVVSWSDFRTVIATVQPEPDLYPPRWLVDGASARKRLAGHAIPMDRALSSMKR